jgi:hypothetical protein
MAAINIAEMNSREALALMATLLAQSSVNTALANAPIQTNRQGRG